jgi:hypothetical protein
LVNKKSIYWENDPPPGNLEVRSEPTLRGWKIKITCWGERGDGTFYIKSKFIG